MTDCRGGTPGETNIMRRSETSSDLQRKALGREDGMCKDPVAGSGFHHLSYRKKAGVSEGRVGMSQGSRRETEAGLDRSGSDLDEPRGGDFTPSTVSRKGSLEGLKQKSGPESHIICLLEGKAFH